MSAARRVPCAIIATLGLAACAPEPEQAATMPTDELQKVLLSVPADPTISLSVSFAVGSQNDPPGKEGLAYLTGRMIAEASTEAHSLDEILKLLYPLAARYDVRVDRERTTLTGRTHRDNVEAYLGLFGDAFLRPAFLESDFERVKNDAINYVSNTLRYSSDEELGKAALYELVFRGTRYAHPSIGTVQGLRSVTLDDVRAFYREHFTRANALLGVGGGFDDALVASLERSIGTLPAGARTAPPDITPAAIDGREVLLVDKPRADASISFGFPIDAHRGERDFYALWIANSWLGEHRNQASHLFQVIREARGLNYGDYSYIEVFPEGGQRNMPPVNVPRRQQLFEAWIRTLPNQQAHFALRAAVREVEKLARDGMSREDFELTRQFLKKYSLHFADTTAMRLGYAVDDVFYDIGDEGHLERFRRMMDELTLEDVHGAIARHLDPASMKIAIVTGDAAGLRAALAAETASPLKYETPKPAAILAEDEAIAPYPLRIPAERISVIPVTAVFEQSAAP